MTPPTAASPNVGVVTSMKQSMREAMEHLLARYREMRPLLRCLARPMKEEWKMRPYLGVLPLVLSALHRGGRGQVGAAGHVGKR